MKLVITNRTWHISQHITPLVINALGGRQTDKQTDTHTHTHTNARTKAISSNHAHPAERAPGLKTGKQHLYKFANIIPCHYYVYISCYIASFLCMYYIQNSNLLLFINLHLHLSCECISIFVNNCGLIMLSLSHEYNNPYGTYLPINIWFLQWTSAVSENCIRLLLQPIKLGLLHFDKISSSCSCVSTTGTISHPNSKYATIIQFQFWFNIFLLVISNIQYLCVM